MTMNERKTIDLEQGWEFMQKGITKLKNILEGLPEPQFSSEDYMMLYTYLFQPHLVSAFVNILLLVIHNFFQHFYGIASFFFFQKNLFTEPSTTCARKSLPMITLNSFMTSTGSLLKNTYLPRQELDIVAIQIYLSNVLCLQRLS